MGSAGSQTTVKALWQGMDTEVWGVWQKVLELMQKQDRVEAYIVWGRQRAIWQLFIQSTLIWLLGETSLFAIQVVLEGFVYR